MTENLKIRDRLLYAIDNSRQEIVSLCRSLVKIPTPNPPGDTRSAVEFLKSYLEERHISSRVIAGEVSKPNLLAVMEGKAPGRHLVFNGHLDVFPVVDKTAWNDPPFSGALKEDKIFGRGSCDMKGGLTASIAAFLVLSRFKDRLRGKITLTIVSDEENMGPWGARYLIDHFPEEVCGDVLINGEPSGRGNIICGEKGHLWIEISARGRGAHSAQPYLGVNAIDRLIYFLSLVRGLEGEPIELDPRVRALLAENSNRAGDAEQEELVDCLSGITVNTGIIRGGEKINLIPERAGAEVDIRIPPGISTGSIRQRLDRFVEQTPGIDYRIIQASEPSFSSPDHAIFRIIKENIRKIQRVEPVLRVSPWGSDARIWRWQGIPALEYGPTDRNMGKANEWLSVDELIETTKVHALTAFDYLVAPDQTGN
ncbi:MAG: ArgE/DapE family deacylase [Candidatus Auribacterota bacterium]|nr:ArgE/DapE family deacylase [Candidatus Auribacterota bacterium]